MDSANVLLFDPIREIDGDRIIPISERSLKVDRSNLMYPQDTSEKELLFESIKEMT